MIQTIFLYETSFLFKMQTCGNYQIMNKCGEGSSCNVYYAIHTTLKLPVALKIFRKDELTESEIKMVKREIELMSSVDCSNIVSFYEDFEDENNIYISMEYASKGTLAYLLENNIPLLNDQIKSIIFQIATALKYLHTEKHIIHRDIKPENILFNQLNKVKIADFGLSTLKVEGAIKRTRCGTPLFASPEMIRGEGYSFKTDIWSFGVLMYVLICRKYPFFNNNIQLLYHQIFDDEIKIPETVDSLLADLISGCLCKDPNLRFDIDQVLNHPYFGIPKTLPMLPRYHKNQRAVYDSLNKVGFSNEKICELVMSKDQQMTAMIKILTDHIGMRIKKSTSSYKINVSRSCKIHSAFSINALNRDGVSRVCNLARRVSK
ncbi:CAMK family protein kinase [Tritrichomonas foetus]|uniref:CAMK family protein kinase n=1 Tax=Tritrichomonas foetus TaxID=1144522 RepID=A0A1J4JSL5_9EUKA|nr:CAMK family protein kinase [Tritrichomonas foetus]|eukprot:OHT02135.1 CAMK family protein kinase [Tritrichomonas foetus]